VRTLGVIVGDPGTGKTTAIEEFARQEQHAHIIRVTEARGSRAALLQRMTVSMGLPDYRFRDTGKAAHWENVDHLISKMAAFHLPLFIVDEAQKLKDDAVEMIREIFDESIVSFVLVCNEKMGERLNLSKSGSDQKSNAAKMKFPQLSARVSLTRWIGAPSGADVKALCAYHRIEGEDSIQLLAEIAARHGHLHQLAPLIEIARNVAGPDQPINFEHLLTSHEIRRH